MSPNAHTESILNSRSHHKKNSTTILDSWNITQRATMVDDDDSTVTTMPSPMNSTGDLSTVDILEKKEDEKTLMCKGGTVVSLDNWGFPGYLSRDQYDTFKLFQREVYSRGEEYQATVFPFRQAHEDDVYALCRWLRAKNFKLKDTLSLVEKAEKFSKHARQYDYYVSPQQALSTCPSTDTMTPISPPPTNYHIEQSIFRQQTPQIYYGHAKNGCPVFIGKPGMTNVPALSCITTQQGMIQYHWNEIIQTFSQHCQQSYAKSNGTFKRYELVSILDLSHLSSIHLSKRPMAVTKAQCEIDDLCFPETLNQVIVINAPSIFTMSWNICKGWLHPQTVRKMSIFGNSGSERAQYVKVLKGLIDEEELPVEYGGLGASVHEKLRQEMVREYDQRSNHEMNMIQEKFCAPTSGAGTSRKDCRHDVIKTGSHIDCTKRRIVNQETHYIPTKQTASHTITLPKDQIMTLHIFTQSKHGFSILLTNSKGQIHPSTPTTDTENGIRLYPNNLNTLNGGGTNGKSSSLPTRYDLEEEGVIVTEPDSYEFMLSSLGGKVKSSHLLVIKYFELDVNFDTATCSSTSSCNSSTDADSNDVVIPSQSRATSGRESLLSAVSLGVGKFTENHVLKFHRQ